MTRRFGILFEERDPPPTAGEVAAWYSSPPGLYLHVPFCRTICPFCPYNKVLYGSERAGSYFESLGREVSMYLAAFEGAFPSLYVGGGTPTLCLSQLGQVMQHLPISGERAIEVLPGHMTVEGARRIGDLGFDFVSIGVQSFHLEVLRRLRRPGSPDQNRKAVETAVGRFRCVDVDLIFDAAYDDPRILLDDLSTCFDLAVDQVSTYPLMRFGYTPFGKGRHDRRREHELLHEATSLAASRGFERRSVWTFNRVGAPTYTSITRPYFLGMGAGAASFSGASFAVNHFGLEQYQDALAVGRLPIARMAHLPSPAAAAYRSFWQAYTGVVPVGSEDPLLEHPVSVVLRQFSRFMGWSERCNGALALSESGYDRYHDLERWVTYRLIEPLWSEMMAEHTAGGLR
jgi:oxygen-independent coproporphyrinogen-3 oxidase